MYIAKISSDNNDSFQIIRELNLLYTHSNMCRSSNNSFCPGCPLCQGFPYLVLVKFGLFLATTYTNAFWCRSHQILLWLTLLRFQRNKTCKNFAISVPTLQWHIPTIFHNVRPPVGFYSRGERPSAENCQYPHSFINLWIWTLHGSSFMLTTRQDRQPFY